MNYLFLDVEIANSFDSHGKIYSLGYVIADEYFNIKGCEKDILINPNVEKWDWYVIKNILAYKREEVENKKKFNSHYKSIKTLLENENNIVCGFNIKEDVGYILDECERYKLEPIQIKFFDVQKLEAKVSGTMNKKLHIAYMAWCHKIPGKIHRSDLDARLTLEIAKAICNKTHKSILKFMLEDETLSGRTEDFKYGFNNEKLETKAERLLRKKEEYQKHQGEKDNKNRND